MANCDRVCGTASRTVRGALAIGFPTSQEIPFVPEGRRKLAGGGAQRNHRSWTKPMLRPSRDAGLRCVAELSRSGALSGRGSCCGVSGGYASLHHRLTSAAPPAQRIVGKLMADAPRTASPVEVQV